MKITFEGSKRLVRFRDIGIGGCYISANPQSDNVYMRTKGGCNSYEFVSLKTGAVYSLDPDKMVCPVECELIVRQS